MGAITLEDVAAKAGVSAKTVSRVINGETSVRGETRERVVRAIEQLGYRPNLFARGLTGAHTYAVGLVYDNPNAYFIIAAQQGALAACDALGYGLQIHAYDSRDPALGDHLCEFVARTGLAGIVLTQPVSERLPALKKLAAAKIPMVRVVSASEDPREGSPCVYVDDRDAAYAITAHLIQLGHARIGFLQGSKSHRCSTERFKGYKQALADYGLHLHNELVIAGDYAFDDGFRGARRLLELQSPPTAIFGCNDEIAAGVLAAVRSVGLHVPYDMSIAGFEDSPFSRQSWPPLTTVRQRGEVIVERATRLLIAQLHGRPTRNEGFTPELVIRGSTAPPRPQ
ncbi:MAG: LacI family DNA-binding transcriptional regulator [Rhodanobacter sp.]|nr:MAG: LacI family DNA-binding transcriptional regulator [Rhodanobacter sp.]TAM13576.1 MAG: LacI family DNA-binding transcriptional regulator [Rhodanobacter sp.]TAM35671.1 MAG: LacI family DNA-binding transcriptional regulator [Rhodanobacter sp.]